MSTVYLGRHNILGYPVAIKFLDPDLAQDQGFINRFEREALQASALESPNIVRTLDYGSEDDLYFIVMEFVDGKDLTQILQEITSVQDARYNFPAEMVLLILDDVCRGLKLAHEKGIVHRDIKPSNILLDQHGFAKVVDFGLARGLYPASSDLTQPGVVLGTPSYMSPEQAAGNKNLDTRCDIFSLGVLTYYLLTGKKPFSGSRASEIQEKIIRDSPPSLNRADCPQLTPGLVGMVDCMLKKNPDKRFATIDQLQMAIQQNLDEIDFAGNVMKARQDHIKEFMKDPTGFAEVLRQRAISENLRRGHHFRALGDDHLTDATQVFNLVTRLDPGNEDATVALADLYAYAEESGIEWAGETCVLEEPSTLEGTKQLRPHRRNLLPFLAPVVLVVLILIAWFAFSPGEDTSVVSSIPDSLGTDVTVTFLDTVSSELTTTNMDSVPKPHSQEPEIPDFSDSTIIRGQEDTGDVPVKKIDEISTPPRKARVQWSTAEEIQVLVNGRQEWQGSGRKTMELVSGKEYRIEFIDEATFASWGQTISTLDPGQLLKFGDVELPRGTLEVIGAAGMTVAIDGREIPINGGESGSLKIGSGDHLLKVSLDGYEPRRASLYLNGERQDLTISENNSDHTVFRFSVEKDEYHKISIIFRHSGG